MDETMSSQYERIANEVMQMISDSPRRQLLIGIAGPPGAGKSTVSLRLKELVPESQILPMDGYHFYRRQLEKVANREEAFLRRGAHWTFDANRFVADLTDLRSNGYGSFPSFDHALGDPVENDIEVTSEHKAVFIEGNYLLLPESPWVEVRGLLDYCYFISCDLKTLEDRIIKRHISVGCSKEEAIDRVHRNDLLNAQLILTTSDRADQIIQSR